MTDLRYALRQLRKSPGFTLIAILTLALGIGANTAIFTVVHAVLLAPLPYPEANRIVSLQSDNVSENLINQGFAPAGFRELEKQATTFESLAASRYNYDNLTGVDEPTSLTAGLVTQDFFHVLGVRPLIGRTFAPDDAAANAAPTVILGLRSVCFRLCRLCPKRDRPARRLFSRSSRHQSRSRLGPPLRMKPC
jgi:putative ABC transport system permease protein